jgi:6-phosphogluconolactonase (cycloisomerase 2 family)
VKGKKVVRLSAGAASLLVFAACGGGGGGTIVPATYTISGAVTGVATGESLTLQDNGGDDLTVTSNGGFTFKTAIALNGKYAVTVSTQPSGQLCTVSAGSGSNVTSNVSNVAVSCANRTEYVYVVNHLGNSISQYSIASDGTLTPLAASTVSTGNAPRSITVDPSHRYVYVTNYPDATISQYVIQADGSLAPNAQATVATGPGPWGVTIDPVGNWVYVLNSLDSTIALYTIDSTGALVATAGPPATAGSVPWYLTISPNGKFLYVSNFGTSAVAGRSVQQYSINTSDGAITALNPPTVTSGSYPTVGAVDAKSAYLYVPVVGATAAEGGVWQYAIGTGGQLTSLAPATVSAGSQPDFIAIDPSNRYAYVANFTPCLTCSPGQAIPVGTVSQYSLGTSGQLAPLMDPTVPAGVQPGSIAFDVFGKFVYVLNEGDGTQVGTVSEYSIGADGSLAPIGTANTGIQPFGIATSF